MDIESSILEMIKNLYGNKLRFCKAAGIPQSTFEAMLSRGITKGNANTISKLCNALNIDMQAFIRGEIVSNSNCEGFIDKSSKAVLLPIMGRISCGYDGDLIYDEIGNIEYPESLLHCSKNECYVLQARGDSMSPMFEDGDYAIVQKCDSVPSGTIAVVLYSYFEATLKLVKYIEGEDWLDLVPTNPKYKPLHIEGAEVQSCRVLGRVTGMYRGMDR